MAWSLARSGGNWRFVGLAGVLVGLDWQAIDTRLDDADSETRTRVKDLLEEIEAGALTADAQRRSDSGEN